MDRRSTLGRPTDEAPHDAGGPTVEVEQAVFTSVASAMGRGYRLVAASPGITADERREIVQRAPSHGSICDPSQAGVGGASFELAGGRRCVMVCCHAEAEHSGRGGYRVHTQAVVFDPASFRAVGLDPIALDAAIRTTFDARKVPRPDARLPRLSIPNPRGHAGPALPPDRNEAQAWADRIAAVAGALLDGRRVLVVNPPNAGCIVRLAFTMLPPPARRNVTLAYGLRFSPARSFQLVLTQARREEIERIICDQPYDVVSWDGAATPPTGGHYEQWVRMAREMLSTQRVDELASVSGQIAGEDYDSVLEKINQLVEDLSRIDIVNLAELREMMARHLPFKRLNDFQTNLHLRFVTAANLRMQQLTRNLETPPT